jgi:voltage-gated potassium channel
MDSFRETQRQLRIAIAAIIVIVSIGVVGFMLIEQMPFLDAIWLTIITLATIGYGDIYARSDGGRIFTVLLILFGIGAVAYGLQATATFFFSPIVRDLRQRRQTQRRINRLRNHFIICGAGPIIDHAAQNLLEAARRRRVVQRESIYYPVDVLLDRIFGDDALGHFPTLRGILRRVFMTFVWLLHRSDTILDVTVIVTPNREFAQALREQGAIVIEGDPTNDAILKRAGIDHAHTMMIMVEQDTEALLTVLTARSLNPNIDITAGTLDEALAAKMVRVGANGVIAPYEVAGRFLNNATLRPAVNEFFNALLFNPHADTQTTQLLVQEGSPWMGCTLGSLQLRERFQASVIGLRKTSGHYVYAPSENYVLEEGEVLIAIAPGHRIPALHRDCRDQHRGRPQAATWQRLPLSSAPSVVQRRIYSLDECTTAVDAMSGHFIICASGRVARSAISKLDPTRPFAIISHDAAYTGELLAQGFRVIHGDPAHEHVLRQAGVERAQALMVTTEDDASSVLTVLNCRTLSKRILITATAQNEELIPKLHRAGADRVVSPFQVAALFVLLATTRPVVSDFLQYVVYNYAAGIETTELYMQNDSPWISKSLADLALRERFHAGVLGIRKSNGEYLLAPSDDHVLGDNEVLIVVTPMKHGDDLRTEAHGSATRRPVSLRRGYLETNR